MDWKSQFARRLRQFANARANAGFARIGYSEGMARDAKREGWWWFQARAAAVTRRTRLLEGLGVTWTGSGRAELLRIEVPRAALGEVTIAVVASAVSPGTERARYLQLPNARVGFPHRPGCSVAGTVIAVGKAVSHVAVGDSVAATGAHHASLVTVPGSSVYRVPDGVALSEAAFIELGVISAFGVRVARLANGESLCVLGCGLIGCLAHRIAVAQGATRTIVMARSRNKEHVAIAGGASRFVATQDDSGADVEADVVIEATGDPGALVTAIQAARSGGRIVLLGSPRGITRDFPLRTVAGKRLTLLGAHVNGLSYEARASGGNPRREVGQNFLELLAEQRLRLSDIIGTTIDPREADGFYRELARDAGLVGALFDWRLLSQEERVAPGRLLRVPDLSGRGMEYRQKPVPPHRGKVGATNSQRRTRPTETRDPFQGAAGMLRVALVGCGDIAVHNAAGIVAAPNVTLVACYDPATVLAHDLVSRFGGEAVPAVERLFERSDVDAVVLSVPHHLHAPLALQAIAARKHVIVEKPLANNLASASAMVAAAERAGVRLSVCFPHRYQKNVVQARELVRAGAVGEIAGTFVSFYADKPPSYWVGGFSGRAVSNWRSSRELAGGGVLIMNLSHYLDLVRHITGVEAISCAAATGIVDRPAEVEDTVSLTLRYANGAVGNLFACSAMRGNRSGLIDVHLWGRDGHIALEPEPQVYTIRALDGIRPLRWHSLAGAHPENIRAIYFSRFATAIHHQHEPDVTAADGLAIQAVIEAAYRSSDIGQAVPVDSNGSKVLA